MSFKFLSPQELYKRLGEGENIILLDTLMDDHFRAVHLPDAINACVYEVIFLDNVSRLVPGEDSEIVVYGSSDKSLDAVTAAEKLTGAGYRDVSVLKGGVKDWKAAGYELQGDDISALERAESVLLFRRGFLYRRLRTERHLLVWEERKLDPLRNCSIVLRQDRHKSRPGRRFF